MNLKPQTVLTAVMPKTPTGVATALLAWCGAMLLWHMAMDWYVIGSAHHNFFELVVEVLTVGAPFAFLFVLGSWHQHKAVKALAHRAYYDPLSGVLNRETFVNRTRKAIEESHRGLLMLIDADHFKRINDDYGHATGDRCISAMGHRFKWHTRECDIVGRLGGEEFAVFLSNVSEQHGEMVAMRIGLPIEFADPERKSLLAVTLSIGAVWTGPGISLDRAFQEADNALYVAKSSGRAQLRFNDRSDPIPLGSSARRDIPNVVKLRERTTSKIRLMLGE